MASPDGKQIMHAEVRIGDSVVYMNDPMGRAAPSKESPATTSIWLYVPDSDALFERAVKAGATVSMPMMDAFWGDRMGMLLDPFGVPWGVATRVKDMSAEELREASEEFARKMAAQGGGQGAGSGAEPPQPQGALGEGVEPPQAQDA